MNKEFPNGVDGGTTFLREQPRGSRRKKEFCLFCKEFFSTNSLIFNLLRV